jgi:hypothetical protein
MGRTLYPNQQIKQNFMKKTLRYCIMAFISVSMAMPARADNKQQVAAETGINSDAVKARALIERLHDIKDMNKSSLSSGEKQRLRQEVRNIHEQLKTVGGGVYLSTAAIIIIILLLILLL